MRIAYMLTSLGIGGAERQVTGLAERMAARGHQVQLIVLQPPKTVEWPVKVDVIRLNMTRSPRSVLCAILRGRRALRSFKPDILHSHTFPANMTARSLRLIGAAPRVLTTIHNIFEGGWQRILAYRITDPLSSHTTVISRAVADRFVQIGAVPGYKCSVITNGIDVEKFAPRCSEETQGAAREGFVWLAAGRDVAAKDFDNLLAAFKLVRSQVPQANLRIAGSLRDRRIPLKGQSFENEDVGGVSWLGHCADMPSTIAGANAFVLSSAWEGMPLVVGEAMAMEKPVVATDVGGVRELIGHTGITVPAKDPRALAKAMLRLMRMSDDERRQMGCAARDRILQRFDMEAKVDEWEALYSRLIDQQVQVLWRHGSLRSEFADKAGEE